MKNLIENVSVGGIDYPIKTTREIEPKTVNPMIKFSTTIDGKEYGLTITYTLEMADDIKALFGLNPEEELKNIITYELKHEIFCKVNHVTMDEITERLGNLDPIVMKYVKEFGV